MERSDRGRITDLTTFDPLEQGYDGIRDRFLAQAGDVSIESRTSIAFERRSWPAKPDVLFEGGNVARSPDGAVDTPYAFQRLTTRRPKRDARLLTVTAQTSAATAQAAHLAASIAAEYPDIWPETIRALLIHSARWTPAMQARFDASFHSEFSRQLSPTIRHGCPGPRSLYAALRIL